jgi:hypothetical protein
MAMVGWYFAIFGEHDARLAAQGLDRTSLNRACGKGIGFEATWHTPSKHICATDAEAACRCSACAREMGCDGMRCDGMGCDAMR